MKNILYVDVDPEKYNNYQSYRHHTGREENILKELRRSYDVTFVYDLHSTRVDSALEKENFDLFLTHLPYHPKDFTYEHSLEKLKGLIEKYKIKGLKAVVYTGADAKSVGNKALKALGVLAIVRKKLDDEFTDASRLKRTLERILS